MTEIYSGMKLYLDDERKAPFGWELVRTANECIQILQTGKVACLSLDHDLSEGHYCTDWSRTAHADREDGPTGYDVALWLEEQAVAGRWNVVPKEIGCHSMNPSGKQRIIQCIHSIAKRAQESGSNEVRLLPPVYHESEDESAWMKIWEDR